MQINFFSRYWLLLLLACGACNSNDSLSPSGNSETGNGQGGSMARFAITGNFLYTVDDSRLQVYDIATETDPVAKKKIDLGLGIETIFPYGENLFIGSQSGMYIFDITQPQEPRKLSMYEHQVACDPVVTDGRYAYITLRTGTVCQMAINELHVVDVQNLEQPELLKRYPMVNPMGLAIQNERLYVCDDGIKVYDATDVLQLELLQHHKIEAFDIILLHNNLLVVGSDGFYQYSIETDKLVLLSRIPVTPAS
ncbi:hypothetical protein FVR03_22040 [Pontibacter qinzhouensis]|uniref:LVIVD repeat-containing protein n=1 Tax=Pontibacter qinzhouensis TaxID=2603253 RepID=A0A5C8IV45_9BACT|nr:hypothetical protein [Pontibacter qinzhouensis]TXK25019.1 hypothetical protein FVR03_22040 [Pontibacter qinzhouensis]